MNKYIELPKEKITFYGETKAERKANELIFDLTLENDRLYQENKDLQQRIDTYENPEDLTLMFMYCDEKAKDKIKELQKRIEEAIEYINKLKEYPYLERYYVGELLEILGGKE